MADIKVYCPHCNTEFEVPEEYLGQVAECSQCTNSFEVALPSDEAIPSNESIPSDEDGTLSTDTADLSNIEEPQAEEEPSEEILEETATSTIKLSRSSIGMVPEVQDSFKLDVVQQQQQQQPQTSTKKEMGDTIKNSFKSQFIAEAPVEKQNILQPKVVQPSIFQKIFSFFKKK